MRKKEQFNWRRLMRHYAARLTAVALILLFYLFARQPQLPKAEALMMSKAFGFTSLPLAELTQYPYQTLRPVHPSLNRHVSWISSVGAAVAINDLDNDGAANDICLVETRSNQVIVAPAPNTAVRYAPFALDPAPLPYDETMAPMGCLPGDFNEDGVIDLLVYYWGRTPILFLQTLAFGQQLTAAHYTGEEIVAGQERWFTNAATQADLNGDGHLDLIIGNYFPDGAHILDAQGTGTEVMQDSMSRAFNGGRNRIFLWHSVTPDKRPSVQFTEAADALDPIVAHGWTLAVGTADLDGDLLPEIYFANDFGPDRLLHNRSQDGHLAFASLQGEPTMTMPESRVLGHDSFKGMGVDFGDLNGDGLPDIYVSNIAAEYALQESHFTFLSTGQLEAMQQGIAPYVDQGEQLGLSRSSWGWDSRLADFNNDGVLEAVQATGFVKGTHDRWPELHELAMGNDTLLHNSAVWLQLVPGDDLSGHAHNPFFVRAADGRFYDMAPLLGLDQPQVTRGIATADVDGDGDLDFAVANQWEQSWLYQNDCPDCGAFLGLRLLLPVNQTGQATTQVYAGRPYVPGRPAIGASVRVTTAPGQFLTAQVDGGSGHSGVRSPSLHFGLGHASADSDLAVEIQWRDRNGRVRHDTLTLNPGWHTLLLKE